MTDTGMRILTRRRPNDAVATTPSNCGNHTVTQSDDDDKGDGNHEQPAKQHTGPDEPELNQVQGQLVPDGGFHIEDAIGEPWFTSGIVVKV